MFTDFTIRYLQQTKNLQALAVCRGCKTETGPSRALDPEYSKTNDPLPNNFISWHPRFPGAAQARDLDLELVQCCLIGLVVGGELGDLIAQEL